MNQLETLSKPKLFTGRFKDEYEYGKKLGRGGFGAVFRARHLTDNNEYAIKRVEIEEGQNLEDILREVRSHAKLKHQNIVVYNTSWLEEQNHGRFLYIAMELGDETLEKWLEKHPNNRDLKQTKFWMKQLRDGLKYIHSKEMLHRDLKPSNILLFHAPDTTVLKISDFGLAKATRGKNGQHTEKVGTYQYMAPEQMSSTYDHCVDIYSLGLIFIEMIYPMNEAQTNSVFTARWKGEVPDILKPKDGELKNTKTLKKSLLQMTAGNPFHRSFAWYTLDDYLREKQMQKLSTVRFKEEYEELGTLGRGAFGVVLKARHLIDNTVYTVEQVEMEREKNLEEILRGVRWHEALEHRNIVACNASWLEEKTGSPGICLYIVMEIGQKLESWLQENPNKKDRPLKQMKLWMQQLRDGLEYIHRKEMFHRDLKPCNILLFHASPYTTVLKISVFGLVKAARDKDGQVTVRPTGKVGTELYMAPEVINGEREYNKSADIYSMGLIFIEMVYPMNLEDRKKAFEKLRNGEEPEFLMPKDGDSDGTKLLKKSLLGVTAIETDERLASWFHLYAFLDFFWNDDI